ncbi:MAG: nucleoside-diphosphate kinase [Sphingomonas bacterium]|uniref:GreA/GreB family elongation factor n=1 Tax=Sphingomonas bacterium TaxID=1895847 RepID=UPI002605FCB7|nr:GreA/GreB family elongation factor [Sphingomonas bacterium]MDB5696479.1 nucleoside-diphosphate kinase [Sphingomonas bacterium]
MSVAFRRESDEEHREPRFELPIPAGPNIVTARGLDLIHARVTELEAALAAADEAGREAVARDLRYWHTRAVTAVVAPAPDADEVGFGSDVHIRLRGSERRFRIVGDDEADPAAGLIAWSAPLARALMGAMAGELVAFGGEPDAVEVLGVG